VGSRDTQGRDYGPQLTSVQESRGAAGRQRTGWEMEVEPTVQPTTKNVDVPRESTSHLDSQGPSAMRPSRPWSASLTRGQGRITYSEGFHALPNSVPQAWTGERVWHGIGAGSGGNRFRSHQRQRSRFAENGESGAFGLGVRYGVKEIIEGSEESDGE